MGTFHTSRRVQNAIDRKKSVVVEKLMVDPSAGFMRINAETLQAIGIQYEQKQSAFVTASGRHMTRKAGFAIIHVGDALKVHEVNSGQPGDLQTLGTRSLQGKNLRFDPRTKKLIAGGPILAAARNIIFIKAVIQTIPDT